MNADIRKVLAGLGLAAAAGVAYLATRSTGPVRMPAFTESRMGPLQEHLVTEAELNTRPVLVPHAYPERVAPAITDLVNRGFAPLYQIPDPQVAALPAEEAW